MQPPLVSLWCMELYSLAPLPSTCSATLPSHAALSLSPLPSHPPPTCLPLAVYGDPTVVGFDGSRFTVGGAPGDHITLLTGQYSACIDAATGVPTTCTVPTITNFWMKGRLIAGPSNQGTWAAPATGGRPLPSTALESMSLQYGDSLWVYVQQRQLFAFVQNKRVLPGTTVGCKWRGWVGLGWVQRAGDGEV